MKGTTIFSDFLTQLGVRHTGTYSDSQFRSMSFKTLFGFSRLLTSYGIPSEGYHMADKSQITNLPVPFVARQGTAFVIVTKVGDEIDYISYHKKYSKSKAEFISDWGGNLLLAHPDSASCEPDYGKHRLFDFIDLAKKWALAACIIFLMVFGFIWARLYDNLATIFLTAIDIAGIYVTWLLILKTLRVKSHAADKMCGVIQKHGCDTVLEQKASSFFGIFSWSEVGITYFSVSFLIMMVFPQMTNYLALVNACCVPFSFWSVWYQKYRAEAWCTLCLTVQAMLWLQFFCYLFGGLWHSIFPLRIELFLMIAAYGAVLLGVNAVMNFIKNNMKS